jgi:hypothetical protein
MKMEKLGACLVLIPGIIGFSVFIYLMTFLAFIIG